MYLEHFGLRDRPFSITPDPNYLYLSPQHQEALAHLLYGVREHGGFVLLTGEVGTGKTTLIRSLLAQRDQLDDVELALCLNPKLTEYEFLASICDELKVSRTPPPPHQRGTLKPLIDALNAHLLATHARGRQTVLIVDEAQNLSYDVLEQVRLLTNLETHRHKLLRIILVGQPELGRLLARPALRQLAQRITARYHLTPLDRADTRVYVRHRLQVAGGDPALFGRGALAALCRYGRGVPRLINIISDRALLGAYVRDARRIDAALVRRAAAEVLGPRRERPPARRRSYATAAGLALVVGLWPQGVNRPEMHALATAHAALAAAVTATPAADAAATTRPETTAASTALPPPANSARRAADTAIDADPDFHRAIDSDSDSDSDIATATDSDIDTASGGAASPQTVVARPADAAPAAQPDETAREASASSADADAKTPLAAVTTLAAVDLDRRLAQSDAGAAAATLLRLWNSDAALAGGADVPLDCDGFRAAPLRCLGERGDWSTLRAYNRPALLTLVDNEGRVRQTLLRSLTDDLAILLIRGVAVPVPLPRLDPLWTGEFVLLWRAPVAARLIGPGSTGAPVDWLRRALTQAGQRPADAAAGGGFDAELRQQVKRFQHSRRLDADGLVGSRTMLMLGNVRPAPDTPRLDQLTLDRV